jgi:hypothetical protein
LFMRAVHAAVLLAVSASPALAQRGPVFVIPGRPDIPIIVNGIDISWSVVEGDFGLARPGLVTPTVVYRLPPPVIVPYRGAAAYEPSYYPKDDKKPGYGRLEIDPGPNRPLPPPAQSYRRSWSSSSDPTPADLPPAYPGYNPMTIAPVIAPTFGGQQPPGPPFPPGPPHVGPPGPPGPPPGPPPYPPPHPWSGRYGHR